MGRVSALAATAALTSVLAGCSSSPAPGGPGPGGPSQPNPNVLVVDIVRENGAQSFSPNPAEPGTRLVAFRNTDTVVHRVRLNDGAIDTGNILPGATSNPVQMPLAGTNYHCSLHPTMIGEVDASDGSDAPPCTGIYCD